VVNWPLNHWNRQKTIIWSETFFCNNKSLLKIIELSIESVVSAWKAAALLAIALQNPLSSSLFLWSLVVKKCSIMIPIVIRFFGYYVLEEYEWSTVFCTSSRAQKKYSSDRDGTRLWVLDLMSQLRWLVPCLHCLTLNQNGVCFRPIFCTSNAYRESGIKPNPKLFVIKCSKW